MKIIQNTFEIEYEDWNIGIAFLKDKPEGYYVKVKNGKIISHGMKE